MSNKNNFIRGLYLQQQLETANSGHSTTEEFQTKENSDRNFEQTKRIGRKQKHLVEVYGSAFGFVVYGWWVVRYYSTTFSTKQALKAFQKQYPHLKFKIS